MYEGSLCLCCMSTEDLVQLFVPDTVNGGLENYAKMLALCLRIPLLESDGHDSICTVCINKLKDFICFKKQALKSISILSSYDLTELLPEEELQVLGLTEKVKIKQEQQSESDNEMQSNHDAIAEESLFEDKEETKKKVNSETINSEMSPCSVRDDKDAHIDQGVRGESSRRVKRPVGRPRTRSPALPYRLRADELVCRECHQLFPNHVTLKVHYNSHFGRHSCSHAGCCKRFMTRASLRKHAAAHQLGPFRCDKCEQEFTKVNTLLSHKRLKHGATPPFRCGECGARFPTATRRRRHRAAAHAHTERRYVCAHCHKTFLDSGSRAKHVSCVHMAVRVACARCGASVRRNALKQHMNTHDGSAPTRHRNKERRFSCKLCGKAFVQKHTLQYHIGSHIRRGEYAGDRDRLLADRQRPTGHCGLLSDLEEDTDEHDLQTRDASDVDECEDQPEASDYQRQTRDAGDYCDASEKQRLTPDARDDDASEDEQPAPDASDNLRPTRDASDNLRPIRDASDYQQPTRDASDSLRPTRDASDNLRPIRDASDYQQPTRDASDSLRPTRDASDNLRPIRDASDNLRPIRDASDYQRLTNGTIDHQRPTRDASDHQRPTRDASDYQRPTRDASDSLRPTRDASDNLRPIRDASDNLRPIRDASDQQQPTRDASDNLRPIRDASDYQRPTRDASDYLRQTSDRSDNQYLNSDASDNDTDVLTGAFEDKHDIYTYLDFSIPSDFDD